MKKHLLIYLSILVLVFASSCRKDFEELNKNPNAITYASDGALFNAAVYSMTFGWNEQLYINVSVLYKENQQAALPFVKWNNYTLGTEEVWANYYQIMPNIRELEKRFNALDVSSPEVKNMIAMLKIIRAYKTFKVTDLFGDIPYSEAGYGFQNTNSTYAKFDTQESIYKSLLEDLKWAADNIDPAAFELDPIKSFLIFDRLFLGDLNKWQKFANSLSLRYAMRMVNKEPALAGSIIKDIIENEKPVFGVASGQVILNVNESAILKPIEQGMRNESKGWSFNQSEHARMGNVMWNQLSSNDSADGSGIYDARAYYFFDTNNNNNWVAYPNAPSPGLQPDGGEPYNYQRDMFYTVKGSGCLYSPVNYHLVRDMDYVPDVFMTGAEVLFLRAEAYQRGIGVAKDLGLAGTAFLDGIYYSLTFWETIMQNSRLPLGAVFSSNITVPSNLTFFSVQNNLSYFTASEQGQLEEIYEQCWIDFFRQPQEAFALSRRTGLTPHVGTPSQVYRFPIPPTEVSYNFANWQSTFGASGDALNQKVWWMN